MGLPVVHSTHVLLSALDSAAVLTNLASEVRGGSSIITIYDAIAAGGYGWDPDNAAIRSERSGADGSTKLGGFMLADGSEFDQAAPANAVIDGSAAAGAGKRLFYTHHYTSQGSALTGSPPASAGTGWMFALFSDNGPTHDRTTDVRLWSGGNADTIPTMFQPSPTTFIAVDPTHSASAVLIGAGTTVNTGSNGSFDPTKIISAGWVHKALISTSRFWQTASRLGYYDAYTVYGGDVDTPGSFQELLETAYAENHFAMAIGGFAQFRPRMAIEFGHRSLGNTEPTYFAVANVSVEFENAIQDTTTSLVRVLHAPFNKIGLEEKLRSGDTWIARNAAFTSNTPWHLRMAANVGAAVLFQNCIIQNAGGTADDCEIDSDVEIVGGLIDQCGKLSVNGGTLRSLAVSAPASTAAVDITSASTLENVAFSNSGSAAFAIEIPDPAGGTVDYDLDGVSFDGFDYDVRVLGSTGVVNLNVLNGGDAPFVSTGTVTADAPALLGGGWVDGDKYTPEAGGGDSKRAVLVAISNDGSKTPTAVAFGGVAMTQIAATVQGSLGLSLWAIYETGAAGVFSGIQTIEPTWSGGAPTNVTYQAATYDHLWQRPQSFEATTAGNTVASSAAVSLLDAMQSAAEIDTGAFSFSFPVSAGSNRVLVVGIGAENGTVLPTGVTYGGQAMTQATSAFEAGTTGCSLWYLNDAGIAAATSDTVVVSGLTGGAGEGRHGAVSFSGVDQTTPFRESGSGIDASASVSALDIEPNEIVVGFHATTGGNNISAWTGELATPADSFSLDEGDDPWAGAWKQYTGASTTAATAGVTGGNARSCLVVGVLQAAAPQAGDLSGSVPVVANGLVLAVGHIGEVVNMVFDGDVTERDEVDRTAETVGVADYVAPSAGTGTGGFTNTTTATGVDTQLLVAHLQPSDSSTGGPTVNVNVSVPVTVTVVDANTGAAIPNARVRIGTTAGASDVLAGLTDAQGQLSGTFAQATPQSISGVVRRASSGFGTLYKPASIVGTISATGFDATIVMIPDE